MKASVLVVGHKQTDFVPYLLKAYAMQSEKDFEVIYTENGLSKNVAGETTPQIFNESPHRTGNTMITNKRQQPRGQVWNFAARRAQGDVLIFTEGNVIPDRYMVESYVRENDGHDMMAGVTHLMDPDVMKEHEVSDLFEGYDDKWEWHKLQDFVWQIDPLTRHMGGAIPKPHYAVRTVNFAAPRDVFLENRGFNARKPDPFPIEWDLTMRHMAHGGQINFVSSAIAFEAQAPGPWKQTQQLIADKRKKFANVAGSIMANISATVTAHG